ncbi:MAG TPA: DUF3341 domain-containing protein [Caulobacteraceae bacterium]|jgi:hypothetical protein
MREPKPTAHGVYGLLAEFSTAEALVEAARKAKAAGYQSIEGFSPFPIDDLPKALGFTTNTVPLTCLIGGLVGCVGGFLMQVYCSLDFPLNIGGRPLIPPEAFALITFEMTVLGAVGAAVLAMLIANRLPRLNHPLFEAPSFHLASVDKFFLLIQSNDPKFDEGAVRGFLQGLSPVSIEVPPFTEEPE